MVALERGIEIDKKSGIPAHGQGLRVSAALYDVMDWLGFTRVEDYVDALPRERERIFRRAKEGGK